MQLVYMKEKLKVVATRDSIETVNLAFVSVVSANALFISVSSLDTLRVPRSLPFPPFLDSLNFWVLKTMSVVQLIKKLGSSRYLDKVSDVH